jgi:hypothetical protein
MKKLIVAIAAIVLVTSCNKQINDSIVEKPVFENIDKAGYDKMQSYFANDTTRAQAMLNRLDTASLSRRGNPNQFYFTCADSWGNEFDAGTKGLAVEVDVKRLHVGNATWKSYWIALATNYIDAAGNKIRDWVQFGYAYDGQLIAAFFRYRWKNGALMQAPPNIIYSGLNAPLELNTKVRFEIKNIEGTTWWTFSRNGVEAFRADLEVTEYNENREACTESWGGGGTFGPALMTSYMDEYKNGNWSHIKYGASNQMSWGINGQYQRPEFTQSQFVIGGNTPMPVGTTWLWFPN